MTAFSYRLATAVFMAAGLNFVFASSGLAQAAAQQSHYLRGRKPRLK